MTVKVQKGECLLRFSASFDVPFNNLAVYCLRIQKIIKTKISNFNILNQNSNWSFNLVSNDK